jgi:catechol 2,3-dioxygenase-like lactoylglutathione lyase family enzyme
VGTATDRFEETVGFFRDTMGLPVYHEREDLAILRLPEGEWVEVFGPRDEHFERFTTGPVVEFLVDDVAAACEELRQAGVEILLDAHSWGDYVWAHFRGPDGRIYGLTSGPYKDGVGG